MIDATIIETLNDAATDLQAKDEGEDVWFPDIRETELASTLRTLLSGGNCNLTELGDLILHITDMLDDQPNN